MQVNPYSKEWRASERICPKGWLGLGDAVFNQLTLTDLSLPAVMFNPRVIGEGRTLSLTLSWELLNSQGIRNPTCYRVDSLVDFDACTEYYCGYNVELKFKSMVGFGLGIKVGGVITPDIDADFSLIQFPSQLDKVDSVNIEFELPDLPRGTHTLNIYATPIALYHFKVYERMCLWPNDSTRLINEGDAYVFDIETHAKPIVQIKQPLADCNFSAAPGTGYAPFTTHFVDLSISPDMPITSRLWQFGDGEHSHDNPVDHTYQKGGIYHPILYVTTIYGQVSCSMPLYVTDKPILPVIAEDSFFTNKVATPTEKFTPKIIIENLTGEGNVFVHYTVEGVTYSLADSLHLPAYGRVTVPIGEHDIRWWLHREVEVSELITFIFSVGVMGAAVSSSMSFQCAIENPEGGPAPSGIGTAAVVVGGLAIAGFAAYKLLRR